MKVWLFTNCPSSRQIEFFNAAPRSGRTDLNVRFVQSDYHGTSWNADKNAPH